ncbi:MAG TPA: RHS repeat-associated core domain-containing protein [Thermoanaerobaculia bacterium]|jgi:RHS repeat-associated protein|nr:RHS repeat-associated core domain-containing protein [Thermoanaerobaculia bacterium]
MTPEMHVKALFALAVFTAIAAAASAQDHANEARGLSPAASRTFGPDTVNMYNGNLSIVLPLHESKGDGNLSVALSLVYNGQLWEHFQYTNNVGQDLVQSLPDRANNAGLGWRLSLTRLNPPQYPDDTATVDSFESADGSRHGFYPTLHEGDTNQILTKAYSRDSSYLRYRSAQATIDMPDGSSVRFAGSTATTGYPTAIVDSFGNTATISYYDANGAPAAANDALEWQIDDGYRSQHIYFRLTPAPYSDYQPKLVDRVVVAAFNGTTATYQLRYNIDDGTPPTNEIQLTGCGNTDQDTRNRPVVFLTRVEMPDGTTFRMPLDNYYTTTATGAPCTSGLLRRLGLRHLGSVEWDFGAYGFPISSSPRAYRQVTTGVTGRRLLGANGAVLAGEWTLGSTLTSLSEKVTTVVDPNGTTWKHYFSACAINCSPADRAFEYGLPFSRDGGRGDDAGHWLSLEVIPAGMATAVRKLYLTYEHDPASSIDPDDLQLNQRRNQRLSGSRVSYDDNGIPELTDPYIDQTLSDFDGFSHYRSTNTSASGFPDVTSRTATTSFNPGNHMPGQPGYTPWTSSTWMLEGNTSSSVSMAVPQPEGGVVTQALYQSVCIDATTGFLKGRRVHQQNSSGYSSHDLVAVFEPENGNLRHENYYGGDIQTIDTSPGGGAICSLVSSLAGPEYRISHTYSRGMRATSSYDGVAGLFLDRDIDASTGLASRVRDVAKEETAYTFNEAGELTNVAAPDVSAVTYVYRDPTSSTSLARVTVNQHASTAGSTGDVTTRTTLDAFGRVSIEEQRQYDGTFTERRRFYNTLGWPTYVTELGTQAYGTTYTQFDAFGRPRRIIPADSNSHVVALQYDGDLAVTRTVRVATAAGVETDALTRETYDAFGRLAQVTEPNGTLTQYHYDAGDRLYWICQNADLNNNTCGQKRVFTYDNRGMLLSEQHPELGSTGNGTVTYSAIDSRGHAHSRSDGVHTLTFGYDLAERLRTVREGSTDLKSFTYGTDNSPTDARLGKLVTATRYNYHLIGTTAFTIKIDETYTYAGRGGRPSNRTTQLTSWTSANPTPVSGEAFSQGWVYDDLGTTNDTTYPRCTGGSCLNHDSARTISGTHTNGWLTAVAETGGASYASAITYHPNGMLKAISRSNGVSLSVGLDPNYLPRPASFATAGAATNWFSGNYSYDGAGNVTRIGSSRFTYDLLSRLKTADESVEEPTPGLPFSDGFETGDTRCWDPGSCLSGAHPVSQSYTYDLFGNLTDIAGSPGRSTPTSGTTNRLTAATYDAAGNLLTWNGETYDYDALGMVERRCPSGCTSSAADWRYTYTADDERLWAYEATVGTGNVWTVRDLDGRALREYDAVAAWATRDYIYRDTELLASNFPSEGDRHFHVDHLGTPRLVTNSAKTIVAYHVYLPFGEEATATAQDLERRKFTGHERDTLGTSAVADDRDYMHARYYNPQLGRFLTTDRVHGLPRSPRSWNRYAYVAANPLKFIDANGATVVVPKYLSNVIAEAMERSATFWFLFSRADADPRVTVSFATQARAKPGSRLDSVFTLRRTNSGEVTELKQQIRLPPGTATASKIGHELAHNWEILDTGLTLEERAAAGERGIRRNSTGWESDAALRTEKIIEIEQTISVRVLQSPAALSATGDLGALGAGFGIVVYVEGVPMPF